MVKNATLVSIKGPRKTEN